MALQKICYKPKNLQWYDTLPACAAVKVGDLLFISGQVALDGEFRCVAPGDPKAQAEYAFERIGELVEGAGGSMDDVVDIMSFHRDAREMDAVFDVLPELRPPAYAATVWRTPPDAFGRRRRCETTGPDATRAGGAAHHRRRRPGGGAVHDQDRHPRRGRHRGAD